VVEQGDGGLGLPVRTEGEFSADFEALNAAAATA